MIDEAILGLVHHWFKRWSKLGTLPCLPSHNNSLQMLQLHSKSSMSKADQHDHEVADLVEQLSKLGPATDDVIDLTNDAEEEVIDKELETAKCPCKGNVRQPASLRHATSCAAIAAALRHWKDCPKHPYKLLHRLPVSNYQVMLQLQLEVAAWPC